MMYLEQRAEWSAYDSNTRKYFTWEDRPWHVSLRLPTLAYASGGSGKRPFRVRIGCSGWRETETRQSFVPSIVRSDALFGSILDPRNSSHNLWLQCLDQTGRKRRLAVNASGSCIKNLHIGYKLFLNSRSSSIRSNMKSPFRLAPIREEDADPRRHLLVPLNALPVAHTILWKSLKQHITKYRAVYCPWLRFRWVVLLLLS